MKKNCPSPFFLSGCAGDGDTSSPTSLADGAVLNLIKDIEKSDLTEEKLLFPTE